MEKTEGATPQEEKELEEQAEKEQEEIKEPEREPKPVTITDIELEQLREEARDYKHKYLHQLADTENARKRMQKDRDEIMQYTIRNIMLDFLHPMDHMENALNYTEEASDEVKHWATGFQMILNQFKDVLANNGVKPFDSLGKEFDPHIHEAVEMVATTDAAPGIIVEENVRGYMAGDKTLRPARVKVAKSPEEDESKS